MDEDPVSPDEAGAELNALLFQSGSERPWKAEGAPALSGMRQYASGSGSTPFPVMSVF
jgi:hypothetical protein